MGDLTEKDSSQPVKIVGADSEGNETSYLDIGNNGALPVSYSPTHQVDAFGRLRVSNPTNLWEYTSKYDIDFDVYWDTETVTGGTVTHNSDTVSRVLSVTSTTGSKAVIQSRRRMEYYPGNSHLYHLSVNFKGAANRIRKRLGAFDDDNGMFFETDGTTIYCVIRSSTSGSVVDTRISRSNWNGDKGDGTGATSWTADPTKGTLFWIDYAWLGIGLVRFGVLHQGNFLTLHTEYISQEEVNPFMQSPHLPFRMELENTGGGVASEMTYVCCAFEVEGIAGEIGKIRSWYQGNTAITINAEAVLWIGRINPNYKYSSARIESVNLMIESGNDEVVVRIYQNPTITSGAITWNDEPNSIMQTANNPNSESINTSTGFVSEVDIIRTNGKLSLEASDLFFGFDINDSPDIFVITADSLNSGADVVLSLKFRELY